MMTPQSSLMLGLPMCAHSIYAAHRVVSCARTHTPPYTHETDEACRWHQDDASPAPLGIHQAIDIRPMDNQHRGNTYSCHLLRLRLAHLLTYFLILSQRKLWWHIDVYAIDVTCLHHVDALELGAIDACHHDTTVEVVPVI